MDARNSSFVFATLQFPEVSGDFYRLTLDANEMLTVNAGNIPDNPFGFPDIPVTVAILDSEGNALVKGAAIDETNNVIRNFRAPAAGEYFLQVRAIGTSTYYLVATMGADIAVGALGGFEDAPNIGFYDGVVGRLSGNDQELFAFTATAGDFITLSSETQPSGAENVPNTLDPNVTLYDSSRQSIAADDNSLDGRNATLGFTIQESGTYFIGIDAVTGAGEYVLRIVGNTVEATDFDILSTAPISGTTILSVPTEIVVNFAETINVATLSPDDISINGQPAAAVRWIDDDSVAFEIADAVTGNVSFEIAAGVIGGLAGGTNNAFNGTFVVDPGPPQIVETVWNDASIPNDRTFASGSMSVRLRFNETIHQAALDIFDLEIFNDTTFQSQYAQSFTYDEGTNTVSAFFGFVDEGTYLFFVPSGNGGIEDLAGNALDGEANFDSLDGTITGDGVEGGDYVVEFQVESGVQPIDLAMQPVLPLGSLTHTMRDMGTVSYSGDVDSYSLELEAGEFLDILVTPRFGGADFVEVTDGAGTAISSLAGSGEMLHLGPVLISEAGKYFVNVAGQTTGDTYDVLITRNGVRKTVDSGAGNPLPLRTALVNIGNERMSVIGKTETIERQTLLFGAQPRTGQLILLDPLGGSIVDQFPAPDALAADHTQIGLAMADGGRTLLYINGDLDPTTVYRLDPDTGEVLSSETIATGSYDGLGIHRRRFVLEQSRYGRASTKRLWFDH